MRGKALGRSAGKTLHILQHALIVTAAVLILVVLTGSSVMMNGVDENYSYSLKDEEKDKIYEDSLLFNYIYGRGVADVASMVAVRSQMETNGRFDGDKEIDVASFYYRFEGLPYRYLTLKYRLEDLIKWGQYGFEYEDRWFTSEQADAFLNRTSRYTSINYSPSNLQGSIVTPFNAKMEEITEEYTVSANEMKNGEFHRDETNAKVLLNRCQTTEGKNLEEYVGTWPDYYELCQYVTATASDLNLNYESYLRYKDYYDAENSNLRFYILKEIGDRKEVYTNIDSRHMSETEIGKRFKEYGKYLYFNPENMIFETNTLIEEGTVRRIFNGFEYAYPESIQVWIGVDTSYPAQDVYIQGHNGYIRYVPYYWQLIVIAGVCIALYLGLYVYLTVQEGRALDGEGNIYIEIGRAHV